MIISKIVRTLLIAILVFLNTAYARDILLEFKGSYFLSTDCAFKYMYDKGGPLYGPEVTFQLSDASNWYGFASAEYFKKEGHSIGLGDATEVQLIPLGLGLKYLDRHYSKYFDFYVGLGFQPVFTTVKNCFPIVPVKQSEWGFGGIAKVGAFVHLPYKLFLDLFIDYSFVKVNFKAAQVPEGSDELLKANVSGVIFGVGLGCRFN